jgi:hypothetical protein
MKQCMPFRLHSSNDVEVRPVLSALRTRMMWHEYMNVVDGGPIFYGPTWDLESKSWTLRHI